MPIYEYACHKCRNFVEVITRKIPDETYVPVCPECGSKKLTRMISRFQFHLSFKSQLDQLDPKYDKMIDASNPDLSFDNLVKQYSLNKPQSTVAERKKFRDTGAGLLPDAKKP